MKIVACVLAMGLFAASTFAEECDNKPLVTVSGTHEIEVAPDEIVVTINIDNREKLLQDAKSKTDDQARMLIALAKSLEIQPRDIVTSYVAVKPVYSYRKNEGRSITYFKAGQVLTLTLRDFSRYDSLMDALIRGGFNSTFVEYDVSDMPAQRKRARANAILAAKEKAGLLAETIGQKIGKAYSIKEVIPANPALPSGLLSNSNSFSRSRSPEEDSDNSPLSIGSIKVSVTVEASFLLE